MAVIRHGDRRAKTKARQTQEELACLEGFWSLQEQLGIKKRPEDRFLEHIPQITLEKSVVDSHE
jgi:hypothetical protein